MLALRIFLVECGDDCLQLLFTVQEIGIGAVHHQGLDVVLSDILGIGFLQAEQIVVGNLLFIGAVPFFDVFLKPVYRRMQVDQQVGLHDLGIDDVEQFLVEAELLVGKIHLGEQQAFGEEVIGDGSLFENILCLQQFLQLFETFGHEKQLDRESILLGILVKFGEKGVVGELFQNQSAVEMFAQQLRKGGFAGAYVAFNGDQIVLHIPIRNKNSA